MTKRLIEDDFTAVEAVIGEKVVWVVPYKDIYEAPTVDAEPIRYGRWIDYTDEGYVECDQCRSATNCDGDIEELNYCWHCGAKMNAERKEE